MFALGSGAHKCCSEIHLVSDLVRQGLRGLTYVRSRPILWLPLVRRCVPHGSLGQTGNLVHVSRAHLS